MKEVRVATFMRGSDPKQTSKGKAKKSSLIKKQVTREIKIDNDLPLQKETIAEFINSQPEQSKGIKWVMSGLEYVEAGISGFHTHVSKRKGLNQAFEDAKAGLFDVLVIYKLDRFGRRSVESLNHAIKFLKVCRIWVVDKNREFTNNGDADEILNFIEFWSAKKASADTSIRVTDSMKLIHKEGFWTGGNPPYGYINHPEKANMLQVVPEEAEIVKQIYHMYTVDGFGMLKIAGILNERGKKTKMGLEWKSENVRKILRNTIYKGYFSYGKTKTTEGEFGAYQKYSKEGEESVSDRYWAEYDVVGEETWQMAQRIKKSRVNTDTLFGGKAPSRAKTGKGMLVGILKCECGSTMTHGTTSNWLDHKRTKKGEPYAIYRCLKRLKAGAAACKAKKGQYNATDLEDLVIGTIKAHIKNMITTSMIDDIKQKTLRANKDVEIKLELLRRDIEKWKKAKENSNAELMKILMGEETAYNKEQLTELYGTATAELAKTTAEYMELESAVKDRGVSEVDVLNLQELLNDWDKLFDNTTTEVKRQMISAVVSEIKLNGSEVEVEIAFDVAKYIESIGHMQNVKLDPKGYGAVFNGNSGEKITLEF